MNLKDLKYLLALAEYRHFGKAAKACSVSQPTLSIQLKKLEQALGVQVFERGQKRVLITASGLSIVEQAKNVLSAVNELERLAKLANDPFSGELRLGVIPSLGPYLLPHILPIIKQQLPKLTLYLYEDKTEALLAQLEQGNLDAVILALPVQHKGLIVQTLFKEPFFLVMPVSHSLHNSKELHLKDLNHDNLLLLEEGHCLRDQALEVICHEKSKLEEKMNYRATSLETLRHMVASGAGITLLPLLALEEQPLIVNKPFVAPIPERKIGMLWRKGSALEPCCKKLVAVISNELPAVLSNLEKKLKSSLTRSI
ncbi:MAG: LysR family transcriptional regulator [Gammaproteobacteria bacterium]|nr:MAG: LysR family transcriptional regulator [Gammaproteobacteria bacterium]